MQINAVNIIPYKLPLRQNWITSNCHLSSRSGWLVEITTDSGNSGYGDCAPLPTAGTEWPQQAYHCLQRYRDKNQHGSPADALQNLPLAHATPAARNGIETALLDLISQAEKKTLRCWLNPFARNSIQLNSMIGTLDKDCGQQAMLSVSQGFQVLKLKVGVNDVENDIKYLEELSAQLPDHIRLRLDANGAWDFKQAAMFIKAIHHLAVESIEEPLREPELVSLCKLQQSTSIALALDESIGSFDRNTLLKSQAVKRLVIKPMARGGLLSSMALARDAALHKMETVVTSTIESAIGLQAAAQLAAALDEPGNGVAHGLATSEWLLDDVAPAAEIIRGTLLLPELTGLGLSPSIDYKNFKHADL